MSELTLYDICGQDMQINAWIDQHKQVVVEVADETGLVIYEEASNIAAWETLVNFAKQILVVDKNIQKSVEFSA